MRVLVCNDFSSSTLFAERLTLKRPDQSQGADDDFLFEHLSKQYPRAFACVQKSLFL